MPYLLIFMLCALEAWRLTIISSYIVKWLAVFVIRLLGLSVENSVCPVDLGAFLPMKGFGRRKENISWWHSAVFAMMWFLWLEKSANIFKQQFLLSHLLWDKVLFYVFFMGFILGVFWAGVPYGYTKGLEGFVVLVFKVGLVCAFLENLLSSTFSCFLSFILCYIFFNEIFLFLSKKENKKDLTEVKDLYDFMLAYM